MTIKYTSSNGNSTACLMHNSISHTLTRSSLLSPPYYCTVFCIAFSHLHTHHCCHLPTTVLFSVLHSATYTHITAVTFLPQYCFLYCIQPLTHTSLLSPPYHSTVFCIAFSHLHTHHCCHLPTTVLLFAVFHSATYTHITAVTFLPQYYCLLYASQPLTHTSLLSPSDHRTTVCCIPVSHLHPHHCCHLPTTVLQSAPYNPPSICDTIYVEKLLLEANIFYVWIWHECASI